MSETVKYDVHHDSKNKMFYINLPGDERALLSYSLDNNKVMDMEHTEVPKSQGGKGIAAVLCHAAFAHAQQQGLKVIPSCTYISRTFLPKNHQYASLIVNSDSHL